MVCRFFGVCAKSAIKKMDLERNRSLRKVPIQKYELHFCYQLPTGFQVPNHLPNLGALELMPSWVHCLLTENVSPIPTVTVQAVNTGKKPTGGFGQISLLLCGVKEMEQMANNIKHQSPAKKMISLRITHFAKSIEENRRLMTLLEVNISLIRINDLTGNRVLWRLFEATTFMQYVFKKLSFMTTAHLIQNSKIRKQA